MTQRRYTNARRNNGTRHVTQPSDLGPAWRSLVEILSLQSADQDRDAAASLISNALTSGHLTVFTSRLRLVADDPDSWDIGFVSRQDAVKEGWALPDLIGPTSLSIALSPHFWSKVAELENVLLGWSGSGDLHLTAVQVPGRINSKEWEVGTPILPTLQAELMLKYIEAGTYTKTL